MFQPTPLKGKGPGNEADNVSVKNEKIRKLEFTIGEFGYLSLYLPYAKRALYHLR